MEPPPARFNLARYVLEAQAAAHPAKPPLVVVLDAGVTEQSERWSYVALAGHPSVAEFAVAEVDAGEGRHIIAAFVVPRDTGATSPESLRAYVQTVLAGYKSPKEIVFASALPYTANGKASRRALLALWPGSKR